MSSIRMSKKIPSKSLRSHSRLRHHRSHHRKNTSPKCLGGNAASSSILGTLNNSIYTCHRRLIRFFSKLARIGTPSSNRSSKGFKVLKRQYSELKPKSEYKSINSNFEFDLTPRRLTFDNDDYPAPILLLLPPLKNKKTIFLDLDETLVHSTLVNPTEPPPNVRADFVIKPRVNGEVLTFLVTKRPGVDQFLEKISGKYEIVVFTAGLREYASLVVDRLDKNGLISHRLYRDSCKEVDGKFVKDLSATGRDLGNVVIVDDNPNSYSLQPANGVPIKQFYDDLKDNELEKLVELFDKCDQEKDMRVAVKKYVADEAINDGNNISML